MTATRLFDRAVIRLRTEDPEEDVADFLQGLVTNDVAGTLPAYAGLLTPQGKMLFDFIVWPGAQGELLLDCEADAADDLVKRLLLYRLRRKIEIDWARGASAGSLPPARAIKQQTRPGRRTALRLAFPKAARNWPISCGSKPMRSSSTASALARGAMSGRKTPRG